MSLINPAILWGLAVVALPVILHFLLRARPKKLLFPALRLVRLRRQNSARRMRLKHLWLLLLRMAVLAVIVLAIARPTLPAANYSPSRTEWLTALAILAAAVGAYTGIARMWRRRRLPNHVFAYRRTLLRAGTGIAALALVALAVVLPYRNRIAAEISSPVPQSAQNLPVSAVFLFDTSLSMSYRLRNLTRLDEAGRIAGEFLGHLPTGSRVAVADTSSDAPPVFQAEESGALDRIQKLQTHAVSLPLADRIRAALALQEDDFRRTVSRQDALPEEQRRDRFVREIYLFTDLTVAGWRAGELRSLKSELERMNLVQVYIIDVGIEKPTNAGINRLRLSSQTVPKGGDLAIDATVDVVGFDEESERTVELHVQNDAGQLVKREQRAVKPAAGRPAAASFLIGGLSRPVTQGELRLVSSDPYSIDDVRYFTVAVTPPIEILVIGESRDEWNLLAQALAPSELVRLGKARYNVKFLPAARLNDADYKSCDVVCLVNAGSPSESAWSALSEFVRGGGGLFVVAGSDRLAVPSYNSNAAQAFLPARLRGRVNLRVPVTLDLRGFQHPVFSKFEYFDGGFGELSLVKVYRRWGVETAKGSGIVAAYADRDASPALIERAYGKGRTLLLTTALDRKGWSDIASLQSGFRFVVLANQIVHYLSRQSESSYNFIAGDDVTIRLPPDSPLRGYLLRKPGLEQLPGEVPAGAKEIVIRGVDQVGQYEIVSRDEKQPFTTGVSANAPATESDFTRISGDELDGILGKGRYSVARSIDGLTRNVAFGRVGQEVFSLIFAVAIAVFCAEHFVANRFYETDQAVEHQ